jgi:hypothetical protein
MEIVRFQKKGQLYLKMDEETAHRGLLSNPGGKVSRHISIHALI